MGIQLAPLSALQAVCAEHLCSADGKELKNALIRTCKWHAVVGGVVLVSTPLVYACAKILGRLHKSQVIKFVGSVETLHTGVMQESDPAESWPSVDIVREAVHVSTSSSLNGNEIPHEEKENGNRDSSTARGAQAKRKRENKSKESHAAKNSNPSPPMGYLQRILAAQRASDSVFGEVCGRVAAHKYVTTLLRDVLLSFGRDVFVHLSIAIVCYSLTRASVIQPPTSASPKSDRALGKSSIQALCYSVASAFHVRRLFSDNAAMESGATPPSITSHFALYSFSVSNPKVLELIFPSTCRARSWCYKLFVPTITLNPFWRSAEHVQERTAVLKSMTPLGFAVVEGLSRLPQGLCSLFLRLSALCKQQFASLANTRRPAATATSPAAAAAGERNTAADQVSEDEDLVEPHHVIHVPSNRPAKVEIVSSESGRDGEGKSRTTPAYTVTRFLYLTTIDLLSTAAAMSLAYAVTYAAPAYIAFPNILNATSLNEAGPKAVSVYYVQLAANIIDAARLVRCVL